MQFSQHSPLKENNTIIIPVYAMDLKAENSNFFDTKRYIQRLAYDLESRLREWRRSSSSSELLLEVESLSTYFFCWLHHLPGDDCNNFEPKQLIDIKGALPRKAVRSKDIESSVEESTLLVAIQQLKPKIKQDCLCFLNGPNLSTQFGDHELTPILRCIVANLGGLLVWKADEISDDLKVQMESLKDNLDLFCDVFDFASQCGCHCPVELEKFRIHFQSLGWRGLSLSILYWVCPDFKEEKMADLLKESSPFNPEVTMMYFDVLTASRPPPEEIVMTGVVVHKFVGFIIHNMVQVDPEQHAIQMLFVELVFLITFLMEWRQVIELPDGKLNLRKAHDLVHEVVPLISSLRLGDIGEEGSFTLHNFLEKTNAVKTEVRKIYIHLYPDKPSFNFPSINVNVSRFIDSVLEILKGSRFHFPKLPIMMLEEELLSLKELNFEEFSVLELQNKHKEIKELWTRIVNMAHNVERAANAFIYMKFLWHDIVHSSGVIEEVKLIKGEMKRIRDQYMYATQVFNSEKSTDTLLPLKTNIPIAEVVVGFNDELKVILDRLTGGSEKLDIVSIVGMGGLGKTTLAKKVYASVKKHFHRLTWCTVSQTFNNKRLYLDILRGIGVCNDDHSNKDDEDLAQILYQSLKGQRYLVVMDDIWDVRAWNVLQMSFPDDNMGSRIMFTSRIRDLVSEAKPDCLPIPLEPLSDKESWELLKKKLFDQSKCPPADFVNIGMQIAAKCKGLPLSIVLVAGILKKNTNLDWWRQVGERLNILIATEDCMDILELSYKHLPEFLKPCFLYFGSFPEDKEIRVRNLMLLWTSEGFIQKHDSKSLEVVAYEYLTDLVGRSLVTATKRSSTGRIKTCNVHDLVHQFCLVKGEKENIFQVFHGNEVSYNPNYRVCLQKSCWSSFLEQGFSAPFVHSLLPRSQDNLLYHSEKLDDEHIRTLAYRFRFLQVLCLCWNVHVFEFPEAITDMILLKCLMIKCYWSPVPSIKKLQNLETLILEIPMASPGIYIPLRDIFEMKRLKHLFVRGLSTYTRFYNDTPPLETLRTFSCTWLPLPYEILEMLFRKIPNVKNLKCQIEKSDLLRESNIILKLDCLSHLESLAVYYKTRTQVQSSFELYFPSTLKKLHLLNFRLPWNSMSVISKLPKLEVLKLDNGILGKTWIVEDEEFQNLKFLRLRALEIEEFNASDNSFRKLEYFVVERCKFLQEIPCRFGGILNLKVIQVDSDVLESSAKQIQEEQRDIGNELLEVLISQTTLDNKWRY